MSGRACDGSGVRRSADGTYWRTGHAATAKTGSPTATGHRRLTVSVRAVHASVTPHSLRRHPSEIPRAAHQSAPPTVTQLPLTVLTFGLCDVEAPLSSRPPARPLVCLLRPSGTPAAAASPNEPPTSSVVRLRAWLGFRLRLWFDLRRRLRFRLRFWCRLRLRLRPWLRLSSCFVCRSLPGCRLRPSFPTSPPHPVARPCRAASPPPAAAAAQPRPRRDAAAGPAQQRAQSPAIRRLTTPAACLQHRVILLAPTCRRSRF